MVLPRLIASAAVALATVLLLEMLDTETEVAASGLAAVAPTGLQVDCSGVPPTTTILGTEGDDVLLGTAGDDVIVGLGGDDAIAGNGGNDTICGGEGNDTIVGDALSFRPVGGNDQLDGGPGNDFIFGEGGNDRIEGGSGDDLIAGDHGDDQLDGGSGDYDQVEGGPGDDTLDGGDGYSDVVSYACQLDGFPPWNGPCPQTGVQVNLAAATAFGEGSDVLASFENVAGSRFSDNLVGDDTPNWFVPFQGDDVVDGGNGDDRIIFGVVVRANLSSGQATGEGADTLIRLEGLVGLSGSTLVGNARDNYLRVRGTEPTPSLGSSRRAQGGGSVLEGGGGDDILVGATGDDRLDGGSGDDFLVGYAGDDRLDGGTGADVLAGLTGDDRLDGGPGTADLATWRVGPVVRVNLQSGTANDGDGDHDEIVRVEDVLGSQFSDVLVGDEAPNILYGEGGDDEIVGGAGNDALVGDAGTDQLAGGAGTDECIDGESRASCELFRTTSVAAAFDVSARQLARGRESDGLPRVPADLRPDSCAKGGCKAAPPVQVSLRAAVERMTDVFLTGELSADPSSATCVRTRNGYVITIKPPGRVEPIDSGGDSQFVNWVPTVFGKAGRQVGKSFATSQISGGRYPEAVTRWEDSIGRKYSKARFALGGRGRYQGEERFSWSEGPHIDRPLVFHSRNASQSFCPAKT